MDCPHFNVLFQNLVNPIITSNTRVAKLLYDIKEQYLLVEKELSKGKYDKKELEVIIDFLIKYVTIENEVFLEINFGQLKKGGYNLLKISDNHSDWVVTDDYDKYNLLYASEKVAKKKFNKKNLQTNHYDKYLKHKYFFNLLDAFYSYLNIVLVKTISKGFLIDIRNKIPTSNNFEIEKLSSRIHPDQLDRIGLYFNKVKDDLSNNWKKIAFIEVIRENDDFKDLYAIFGGTQKNINSAFDLQFDLNLKKDVRRSSISICKATMKKEQVNDGFKQKNYEFKQNLKIKIFQTK